MYSKTFSDKDPKHHRGSSVALKCLVNKCAGIFKKLWVGHCIFPDKTRWKYYVVFTNGWYCDLQFILILN